MDQTLIFSAVALAASSTILYYKMRERKDARGRQTGSKVRLRSRRSVASVHQEIGDVLFRRTYRMTYSSFLELHRILEPELVKIHKDYQRDAAADRRRKRRSTRRSTVRQKTWQRFVPNGKIRTSVRLAIALRYFAGGSLYDLAPLYGVGRSGSKPNVNCLSEVRMTT